MKNHLFLIIAFWNILRAGLAISWDNYPLTVMQPSHLPFSERTKKRNPYLRKEPALMSLEAEIRRLKRRLSSIDTSDLLGSVAVKLMTFGSNGTDIANSADIHTKTNLPSPLRQYQYLCGLLLTTNFDRANSMQLNDEAFRELEIAINDITDEYQNLTMQSIQQGDFSPMSVRKSLIASEAFSSYYNMGQLNYTDQVCRRIDKLFSQFDAHFLAEYGLSTSDFLSFYNAIHELVQKSVDDCAHSCNSLQQRLDQFVENMTRSGENTDDAESLLAAFGEEIRGDETFMSMLTNPFIIKQKDLSAKFGEKKTTAFLSMFAMKRKEDAFTYYTDDNPLRSRPLVEISDGEYFVPFVDWVAEAIYRLLNRFVSSNDTLSKKKGVAVENYVIELFKHIFGDQAKYYQSVCEAPKTHEHDILILYKNNILIVEVKGSNVRAPLYNLDRSIVRIERHFFSEAGIGYAYNQAIKLKKLIESSSTVTLFANKKDAFPISGVGKKILPIVITLESFGAIEINTSLLIAPEKNQPFPWACWVDDLENIIKVERYLRREIDDFIRYIRFRQKHHAQIYASDELEIHECFVNDAFAKMNADEYILIPMGKSLIDKITFEEQGIPYEYQFSIGVERMKD